MQTILQKLLQQVIQENYNIILPEIKLDTPPKKELGDFAFGAFALKNGELKNENGEVNLELKKLSPVEIAKDLSEKLAKYPEIESVKNEGPYVNIKLNKDIFTEKFLKLSEENLEDKFFHIGKGERIVVDYIGPNVGKPLHIGHMCSPNQGQTMINVYKKLGYDVISDSHIGDWGIIFGKLILAYKMWGDEKKLKENAVEYLFELYVRISAYIEEIGEEGEQKARDEFKLLSEGNPKSIELWKEFTSYSINSLYRELARLNIKSDYDIGESFYEGLGLPKLQDYPDLKYSMKDVVKELIQKGIATKNEDGSVGVVFPPHPNPLQKGEGTKTLPSCILQKRDGTHGYLASDLACVKYRMENWSPSKIVYFVDIRQQLHLQQVFEISRLAGWLETSPLTPLLLEERGKNPHPDSLPIGEGEGVKFPLDKGGQGDFLTKKKVTELFHAANGYISLKEGAMSTRHGRIVKLSELLDEAEKRAKDILKTRENITAEELDKLSRIIGIGAIKYGYLKKSRETDVIFDWDEFMAFEGNSGPYIQYSYVRAKRILEKATSPLTPLPLGEVGGGPREVSFDTEDETNLVKLLLEYENVLLETASKNMPHILCKYAYDLTRAFSSLYNNIRILEEKDKDKKVLRLKLVDYFARTLKDVFELLAIDMPGKM